MNVMMTGRRRCALALLLAALVLSGCGKKDAPDAPEALERHTGHEPGSAHE